MYLFALYNRNGVQMQNIELNIKSKNVYSKNEYIDEILQFERNHERKLIQLLNSKKYEYDLPPDFFTSELFDASLYIKLDATTARRQLHERFKQSC